MKKRVLIPALLLILLLSGCDLRNRKPSSQFIPNTTAAAQTSEPSTTEKSTPVETEPKKKELTRHSVRTVVSEIATYTDIYGTEWHYEFRLPFVDFPSIEASNANMEIDSTYRTSVTRQVAYAEQGKPQTVTEIDYSCYYTGEYVTVNVWETTNSGEVNRRVFCFRPDGTMATPEEILKAVWIDPEDFLAALREKLKEIYIEENAGDEDCVTYDRYLELTLQSAETFENVTLYADEEDKITATARLYDAHGGLTTVERQINP